MSSILGTRTLTVNECIGATVNQLLFTSGVSRTDFSRVIGIAQPNVAPKLKGRFAFSPEQLMLTAELFGIDVDTLMPTIEDGFWVPSRVDLRSIPAGEDMQDRLERILSRIEALRIEKADSLAENRPSELYAIRDSNPGPTD